jgi:hypothetical protein
MQLKYNNYVRNKIVYIDLETTNFTPRELKAFMKFGEPVVSFHKGYAGDGATPEVFKFRVDFDRRIKTSFKLVAKFDGKDNLDEAVLAANDFFDEVKEELENVMVDIMDKLADLEIQFISGTGLADIAY